MNDPAPPRGRPPLAELGELRTRALRVLLEHGYATVTMVGLARQLGMSVRTLHRYFPAKADIVWGGIEGSIDALRRGFAAADERAPIIEAITEVIVAVFEQDADEMSVGRLRLRVIATNPELQTTRPDVYRRWREATIEYVARRLGTSPHDLVPRAVGAAVQTVVAEALAWWAVQDDDRPAAHTVAEALRGLDLVTGGKPR